MKLQITVLHGVSARLASLLECFCCPRIKKRGFSKVSFHGTGIIIEGDVQKIMAQINQTADATAAFVNRHGTPVVVETPEWSSSDESVATVVADVDNPLIGHITTVAVGDCVIVVRDPDPDNDPATTGAVDLTAAVAVRPDDVTVGGTLTLGEFTDVQ